MREARIYTYNYQRFSRLFFVSRTPWCQPFDGPALIVALSVPLWFLGGNVYRPGFCVALYFKMRG